MYFGQPVANLREFLPDEAIPPIKMGDGEAPVVEEFKYLGSMLSKNFDDSVTIMARIGTGALKVAVYIKLCPQKPRLRKRRPRSSRKRMCTRTISVT